MSNSGVVRRIDDEMNKTIQDFAMKNDMKFKEASRELARSIKQLKFDKSIKKKIIKELKF